MQSYNQKKHARRSRLARGQAISMAAIVVAVFFIGMLGCVGFELGRVMIARDQLRTATEAAALAATAALTTENTSDGNRLHDLATQEAMQILKVNDVMSGPLTNAIESSAPNPGSRECFITFKFLDPSNNNAEVPRGDKRGRRIQIAANYGLPSMFGSIVGISAAPFPLNAVATGGANPLDVSMTFDMSSSMDFATPVTYVRRTCNEADPVAPNRYEIARRGIPLEGRLDRVPAAQIGCAMPPQQLSADFSALMRGRSEAGSPGGPGVGFPNQYSDLVVNIDGSDHFGGMSADGFDFPNLGTLVEASRGNLENAAVFQSSRANLSLGGTVSPRAGYRDKYLELARKHVHPLNEAKEAAISFFTILNNSTDARFGLVCFDHEIANAADGHFDMPRVSNSYPQGGVEQFDFAHYTPELVNTNFNEITAKLPRLTVRGATALFQAFNAAGQDALNRGRPNSRKAVILFTDGFDTVDRDSSICQDTALRCKNKGVRLYCVGLSINPSDVTAQRAALSGLSDMVGNGSKTFVVTDPDQLRSVFSNIARELVQLVD